MYVINNTYNNKTKVSINYMMLYYCTCDKINLLIFVCLQKKFIYVTYTCILLRIRYSIKRVCIQRGLILLYETFPSKRIVMCKHNTNYKMQYF